jgi:hypothetical protein
MSHNGEINSLRTLKTSWERKLRGVHYYVIINPSEVVIGSGFGHTDNAVSCSFKEFVDGKYNDLVEQDFGSPVLAEVIKSATLAPHTREHHRNQAEIQQLRDYLDKIPFDQKLKQFTDNENYSDNGNRYYGALKDYTTKSGTVFKMYTRLETKSAILIYGPTNISDGKKGKMTYSAAYLISKTDGTEKLVDVGISPADGISYRDTFYIESGSSFVVLNDRGQQLSKNEDRLVFGERLRITHVIRIGNDICFRYYWFSGEHPKGFLLFDEKKKTFSARWEFPEERF